MENFKYTVVDLETSVKNTIGSNKANPHCPENKIVLAGFKTSETPSIVYTETGEVFIKNHSYAATVWNNPRLLIGVNLPFDLKYLYRDIKNIYDQRGKFRIWDCQIAEYLLSQQRHKYPSLDQMAFKRGGTVKNDEIKKHWEAGGQTEDIDPAKLRAYLEADINNTELVFKSQAKEAVERGMLPLIMAHMDAVLAITEMEYNGIQVYKPFVEEKLSELANRITASEKAFKEFVLVNTDVPAEHININSPKSLSTILYGGKIKTEEKKQVGFYKNGNPKIMVIKGYKDLKGYGVDPVAHSINKTVHGYSTDEHALKKISGHALARLIEIHRELTKDFGTYFQPVNNLIFPDGKIHQNLNQTATDTGRLSCTEPNLQNQTDKHKSEIKKAFVSRWGDNGVLVEFDYKQIEIVALAQLTGDKNLIEDCNNGVDIHTELFRNMHGRLPTDWERKQFKRLSFALIYGSGIKNMAQQAMVKEEVAKNFKKTFESKYPGVKQYREKVKAELAKNRVPMGYGTDPETKLPLASSFYKLPTGRELYYREYVQNDYGGYSASALRAFAGAKKQDFSYTQICNYPVQSFATGDIVPIMLGKLYRYLVNSIYKDKTLLINTVHDSILLDIHKDIYKDVIPIIKELLEEVPAAMKSLCGLEMTVTPKVSVSVGADWFDQVEYKETK